MADELIELPIEGVRRFTATAFEACGMAPLDAATVADNMLWADLRGVDTHGVMRLPWYVKWFEDGRCDPTTQLDVVKETPTSLVADGGGGLGQLVITRLMERLIVKAGESGLVVGTIRNSNDWGCGANYPVKAAQAGFVCFGTTTSIPNLAPFGSRQRLFGNNPMVFAFPRRGAAPIVHDYALTPVALGKVLRAKAEGQPIPEVWGFLDRDGHPTTDPDTALAGIIPAIGGYKGTNLALVTNVLAGILSGSSHSSSVDVGRRGQFFLLVDPGWLGEAEDYYRSIDEMVAEVREAGSGDNVLPGQQVYLPGEIEQLRMDERTERGVVPYPPSVVRGLQRTADKLDLDFNLGG